MLRLAEMRAVQADQRLADDVSKPEERRHPALLEVVHPTERVNPRFLKDVVGVDALHETRVETEVRHAPEFVSMLREERS